MMITIFDDASRRRGLLSTIALLIAALLLIYLFNMRPVATAIASPSVEGRGAFELAQTTSSEAILFVRPQPGTGVDTQVWITNADGSNQTQLTDSPGEKRLPNMSPDGSRIAFSVRQGAGQNSIWVMDSDGSNAVQLPMTGYPTGPVWSPDGSKLSFHSEAENWWEIWTVNPDGTGAQRLTTHSPAAGHANWSPNGQKLVYGVEPSARRYDLYTVNSDGTGQSLLISANSTGFSNHIPAWSPDGTEIATLHFPSGSFTGPYSLWVMNADGTGGVALADGLSSAYSNPGWSSDGSWLAFTRNDQVWRIQRDGTQLTQVTTGGGWEPSIGTRTLNIPGNVISFTRPEPASGEETNIWIMDADGSNQT